MIVASLLMLLSSCHGNRKRLFPSKLKDSYLITYSKNEIVVASDGSASHFIYKNGEYYTSFGSDSIVFFSTGVCDSDTTVILHTSVFTFSICPLLFFISKYA